MRRLWTAMACGVMLLGACQNKPRPTTAQAPGNLQQITQEALEQIQQDKNPKDPMPHVPVLVYLDVYLMDVPLGTVSRNEEFWKRINEQCVDVTTYDRLYKNGVRVGQAPIAEWDYFRKIIDQNPTQVVQKAVRAAEGRGIELEARKDLPEQTIGWWDAANELTIRTFDRSDNLLALSFIPAPRRLGDVRVTLCPTVRATRKRWIVTRMGEELQTEYVAPERLYDLNLCSDVPPGTFLIVAPSADAKWEMSLGRAFFIKDGLAERFEQLLLIVPRPYAVGDGERAMAK